MSRVPRPRRPTLSLAGGVPRHGDHQMGEPHLRGSCPRGVAGRPRTREAIVNMDMTETEQAALVALLTVARGGPGQTPIATPTAYSMQHAA